jgi:hypothetical protein
MSVSARVTSQSASPTASVTPVRLTPSGGTCSTTKTAPEKSGATPANRASRLATPPADAPHDDDATRIHATLRKFAAATYALTPAVGGQTRVETRGRESRGCGQRRWYVIPAPSTPR